jgi:regulatory protein
MRKIRERGWNGATADPNAIAERMAGLGYIDDRAFAEAKARSLVRRGYGERRVSEALRAAHVEPADAEQAIEDSAGQAFASALALARRRRFGPFATAPADDRTRERQMAAMIRAGHSFSLARRIISAPVGEVPEPDA